MTQPAYLRGALAVAVASLAASPALAQNPNSGIAPSGQELTVDLTCNSVVDEGDASFTVSACATLGPRRRST